LVAVLAVAVAAALAGSLWWWRRLAVPGWRAVLARIGALCVLQLSVVSLIFVVANRSAEFYSSWSDLFGTDHGSGAIVAVGFGASRTVAPVKVLSSVPVLVPGAREKAGGRLQAVQIHGALSGLTAAGYVYVPERYLTQHRTAELKRAQRSNVPAQPAGPRPARSRPASSRPGPSARNQARSESARRAAARRRLPVLVVISDTLTSQGALYGAQRLAATAASQIEAGRLAPLLIVMLPAQVGRPASAPDLSCLDVPGQAQATTYFAQDLPSAMKSAYQVAPRPSGWALLGDPGGGYCAMQLALTNSQVFSAVAAPPGDYIAPPGSAEFGGSQAIKTQDDLLWQLRHWPMQPVSVLFTGRGRAQQFLGLVRPPMRAESMSLPAGKWPLAPVLDWIGRTIGPSS
jgi:hypothetical protein